MQDHMKGYEFMMPQAQRCMINTMTMGANPSERYIRMTTSNNHEFWFIQAVNFDEAIHSL